jgi:methionine-rich copper-binding protein CopC
MSRQLKIYLIIMLLFVGSLCTCLATSKQQNNRSADQDFNPFSAPTTISIAVDKKQLVKIKIFDMSGKEIETLLQDTLEVGTYEVTPDTSIPSGVYLIKYETQDSSYQKKQVIIR